MIVIELFFIGTIVTRIALALALAQSRAPSCASRILSQNNGACLDEQGKPLLL